mmetsp:Transcript_4854/g.6780  ORF Transcript_4854/g.6780 Transcript_4854/m.6780 type:complete len:180 (-) Transcript_4854:286-825(-)
MHRHELSKLHSVPFSLGDESPSTEKFLLSSQLAQSAQFQPLQFFLLQEQPEPFQRKSYLQASRKELRYFKPQVLKIIPLESLESLLKHGTAIMQMVDDTMQPIDGEVPQVCEMQVDKTFCFNPTATKTSKGRQYRLKFVIHFELLDGNQKTETIHSSKFKVASRKPRPGVFDLLEINTV